MARERRMQHESVWDGLKAILARGYSYETIGYRSEFDVTDFDER